MKDRNVNPKDVREDQETVSNWDLIWFSGDEEIESLGKTC